MWLLLYTRYSGKVRKTPWTDNCEVPMMMLYFSKATIMSTDTNPRRDGAEGRFAILPLIIAVVIYAIVLCASYL